MPARLTTFTSLNRHPMELNRDAYLKQGLVLDLMRLDQMEIAFADKALVDCDVASGVPLVKVAGRRATLLGLNAPLGHAVRVIQHRPINKSNSTDRIESALNAFLEEDRRNDPSAAH